MSSIVVDPEEILADTEVENTVEPDETLETLEAERGREPGSPGEWYSWAPHRCPCTSPACRAGQQEPLSWSRPCPPVEAWPAGVRESGSAEPVVLSFSGSAGVAAAVSSQLGWA